MRTVPDPERPEAPGNGIEDPSEKTPGHQGVKCRKGITGCPLHFVSVARGARHAKLRAVVWMSRALVSKELREEHRLNKRGIHCEPEPGSQASCRLKRGDSPSGEADTRSWYAWECASLRCHSELASE